MKTLIKALKDSALVAAAIAFLPCALNAAETEFRRDINPALIYFQAYQAMPQLNEEDTKHLFETSLDSIPSGKPFDERARKLLTEYDNSFKLLNRARFSQVPCEWGYDLSDGPEALLGGLAPAKRLTQAAVLRAHAALDDNNFEKAASDLLAAFVTGRNLATDGILISSLVQFAIENIVNSYVAGHYYRFTPEQLDSLIAQMDAAPRRGLVAATIAAEKTSFFGYTYRRTEALIAEAQGNSGQFWTRFQAFWDPIATDYETKKTSPTAAELKQLTGGNPAQIIQLLNEMPALYDETERVLALPWSEFSQAHSALTARITASSNPFIKEFFPVFHNLRGKEFSVLVRHEMIRAAAAYKKGGPQAFAAVADPLTGKPFEFTRFQFEGVDRGFKLRTPVQFRDFDEVLIFVEKPGKPFRLDGKNAGKPK